MYVDIHMFRSINVVCIVVIFFFQAEDGIRDLVRSRGLGDVYKRQQKKSLSYLRLSVFGKGLLHLRTKFMPTYFV